MASKLDYRIIDQTAPGKLLSRADVWTETRDAKRAPLDMNRVIHMYGTDESVDRHNTKLRVDGWDFSDYRKNPTFLWAHNNDLAVPMMPLGSVVRIQREEFERADAPGKVDKRLLFDIEFPSTGTYPFADLVFNMYKQEHLRASSVGFKNIEMRRLSADKDKEEMEKDGYDLKNGFAAELTKNALIELSAVPVGSNPNALQKALHAAAPAAVRGILDYSPDSGIDLDQEWIVKRLEALRVALASEVDSEDELENKEIVNGENVELLKELTTAMGEAALTDSKIDLNVINEQLKKLSDEVRALREDMKKMRASTDEAPAASKSAETHSHLDMIIAENIEALERIEKLFK